MTGSSVGADIGRLLAAVVPITLARCAVRSKWSRHLPTCCIRPTVRRWARGWRGRWSDAATPSPGSCRASASAPSSTASPLSWPFPVSSATRPVRCSSRCRATPTRWPRSPTGSWRRRRRSRASPPWSSRPGRSVARRASRSCPAAAGRGVTPIPPDVALCDDCLRELFDPTDRRYRHPFITCTNCGPRFTIITGLPYDRPATTMAGFPMCAACAAEYSDPADRRFHAQPVCCPDCGPTLTFAEIAAQRAFARPADPRWTRSRATRSTARGPPSPRAWSSRSRGSGATTWRATPRPRRLWPPLRARKARGGKPFAVMVRDLAAARALAEIDDAEAAVLTSPARPVVLLRRRAGRRARRGRRPGQPVAGGAAAVHAGAPPAAGRRAACS